MTATAPARRPLSPAGPRWREVLSPEGVPLRFSLAALGDRATAFLVDVLVMTGLIFVLALLLGLSMGSDLGEDWLAAFVTLALFAIRSFYFPWFELRRQGVTPGKRRLGLRVIRAEGGALTADAIFARNLTREIEFWVPLTVLLLGHLLWPDLPGWLRAASGAWLLVCVLVPCLNRDRLRLGDLAGGTLVVYAPRGALLPDLGAARRGPAGDGTPAFAFTNEQLDAYGIYELQVLEDVLRRRHTPHGAGAALAVARQIQAKIRWQASADGSSNEFLLAYYAALRARLERRMLFGKRKEDKHSREA